MTCVWATPSSVFQRKPDKLDYLEVRSTSSSRAHMLFSSPAAIAGVVRGLLCWRTKL
jgi:hypothetical protein